MERVTSTGFSASCDFFFTGAETVFADLPEDLLLVVTIATFLAAGVFTLATVFFMADLATAFFGFDFFPAAAFGFRLGLDLDFTAIIHFLKNGDTHRLLTHKTPESTLQALSNTYNAIAGADAPAIAQNLCRQLDLYCLLKTLPHTFKWDTLHDGIKETFHHQLFGFLLWNAARF